MRRPMLLMLATCAVAAGVASAQTGSPSGLNVYPSFHVKFEHEGKSYLLASTVIVNVSDKTVRNLTLKQTYPDEFAVEPSPEGIHEYFSRPEGFEDSVEGPVYSMRTPLLRRGEITSALVLLRFNGRPSSAEIPPAEINYEAAGERYSERGPRLDLDLKKYSKYSGRLPDFIKRYAGIILDIPATEGPDWGFSGFASRVRAKTPIGMVEIEGDQDEGRFSLIRGAPGETRVILVAWEPEAGARPATNEAQVLDVVRRQIMPSPDFVLDTEAATVEKERLGRRNAWTVTSRWRDRVVARLGEGPVKWYVIDDSTRRRRYILMIAAQGRGAGPGKSDVPNPEKETQLMQELEEILGSFRPV